MRLPDRTKRYLIAASSIDLHGFRNRAKEQSKPAVEPRQRRDRALGAAGCYREVGSKSWHVQDGIPAA